ncbi:MAG: IS110 family transposase [Clostridiales Family XIII bacterium]|nr:IS110 family transposase [Clostridiales Family XIII bacterium]
MKIIHPICCGVDVHKRTIVATIATTDKNNITSYSVRTFSALNADLYAFRDWLLENNCLHVCMESTGKYWIPIFNILEDHIHVILTHPKYVRAIKGKKTDKKDSKWIAGLFKHDMARSSFIPPREVRALRELAGYRAKLVYMRSSEKNRYQNCMTVSNIGLANVLSDSFGQTCSGIMKQLLASEVFDEGACKPLIKNSAKKKTELILESIRGCSISPDRRFKMNAAMSHMDFLNEMILKTEVELYVRLQSHYHLVGHISALPGISQLSAALILSEIGFDMNVFESAKHLTSWAGLTPANNESAGKKKSVRIPKAGQFLKPLLVQCALAAAKDKKNPYFAIKYQRIKKRRGHKKAIIAIARMMLVCICHMLQTGECFNPSDYEEFQNPNPRRVVLNEGTAIEFLREQGYDISALKKAM